MPYTVYRDICLSVLVGRYISVSPKGIMPLSDGTFRLQWHMTLKLSVNSIFGDGGTENTIGQSALWYSQCVRCVLRSPYKGLILSETQFACTLWWPRRKVFFIIFIFRILCMTINASAGCQLIKRKMHTVSKNVGSGYFIALAFLMKPNEMFAIHPHRNAVF